MQNKSFLPNFSNIDTATIVSDIDNYLQKNREQIQQLLQQPSYSWENFMAPMEQLDDELNRYWSPISHLHSVMNSPELREAYGACIPKLSDYATELGQNQQLYQAIVSLRESKEFANYSKAQQTIIEHNIRDFKLSGVALSDEKKQQFKTINKQLSELTTKFEQQVLDATDAWSITIDDEAQLAGIPEHAIAAAKQLASQKKLSGYVFNLEFPSYYAVITYADDAKLREQLYRAYVTRASDKGPSAGKWDNTPLMDKIVALRHQQAQLLDFDNYAQYSLATKMAKDTSQVMSFLTDLATRAKPIAQQDFQQLSDFAKTHYQIEQLNPWDIPYYSEKLRLHRYDLSQEQLRPYFLESNVLAGMFQVINRLYGMQVTQRDDVDVWHPDVRFYDIHDADNNLRGQFYIDLYARANKRGGAWMDECTTRRKLADGSIQIPVAYLTCNFSGPTGDKPALFTHDEVVTLFHEFGHGLHHMLTQMEDAGVSGINGVAWDAVELPSQFLENWCWNKEAMDLISGHYQTGEKLPQDLFDKMIAAKNFQAGMGMVRQLEFSLFDFRIHSEYNDERGANIQGILNEVRAEVAVVPIPDFNCFQHSFGHIFAGGYAAGYYSYKWAEVLSSDAFSLFEEQGIFDRATGKKFLSTILENGGSYEPMELFVEFRGREPNINALLRHNGLEVSNL